MLPKTKDGLRPRHQPARVETQPLLNGADVKGKIFETLWSMKKNGYSEYTIKFTSKALKLLNKHCDLNNPESIKLFLTQHDTSDGYKKNLVHAYERYLKHCNLSWRRSKYYFRSKLPKIPSEAKINMIISASNKKLALQLKISMETGLRPIELVNIKVKDIDFEKSLIYPTTAKHGNPRTVKIKSNTLNLLRQHVHKKDLQLNDKIFKEKADYYSKKYRETRNKLAKKLNDPSIKSIRLYDLRHFYATMLYHKTKDILYVKQQLGHKKLETTLIYTQLVNFESDAWRQFSKT